VTTLRFDEVGCLLQINESRATIFLDKLEVGICQRRICVSSPRSSLSFSSFAIFSASLGCFQIKGRLISTGLMASDRESARLD
jgi:hypothetical protein